MVNQRAVEMSLKFALAAESRVHKHSLFERKNYFYPDLPKGYQITQHRHPIASGGSLKITLNRKTKKVPIKQIQMEEDSGKSIHEKSNTPDQKTFLDFNRSGIPLLEIVTEPAISSPEEALKFLKKLTVTLQYLNICNCNMEQGSLRCDANISVKRNDTPQQGPRIEIKNLNSFNYLYKSLDYEINRQAKNIKTGVLQEQETRFWDHRKNRTVPLRTKEQTKDYRFFPDPDLPPLVITQKTIHKIKKSMPESPDNKLQRFRNQYKLPLKEAQTLVSSKEVADYFESAAQHSQEPSETSHWILRDILNFLKENNKEIFEFPISPQEMAELIKNIKRNQISRQTAKEIVFYEMIRSGKRASDIIKEKKLNQISDKSQLRKIITEVLEKNQKQITQYLKGKKQVIKYFVGQVMKKTKGRANPQTTKRLLIEILEHYNVKNVKKNGTAFSESQKK